MLRMKEVKRTMANRRVFRTLARDNCGESMEPSEAERMYFGYHAHDTRMTGEVIACASLQFANETCCDPNDNNYYHWVTWVFIHRDFKHLGHGRRLLEFIEIDAWNHVCDRPVRTDAAYKAVGFFQKCGYKQLEEQPRETCAEKQQQHTNERMEERSKESLQKEVDRLTALLQLSERKRYNQKIVYDKNLENLHEKLADFESILVKEQKEVELLLKKKEQQLKTREELAETLQSRLDSRYCAQCGYPNSRNKFDTDWEIDITEEESKQPVHKLPPLSLPSPENLPQVTFSNRPSHFKSKLSPVVEECEVASSSYLRNIHADQTPDRFHAVLTASLECLQVVDFTKKNITPESEGYDDGPACSSTLSANGSTEPLPNNMMQPRRLSLDDSLEELRLRKTTYNCPRPSMVDSTHLDECNDDGDPTLSLDEDLNICDLIEDRSPMTNFATGIAASILQNSLKNVRTNDRSLPKNEPHCIERVSSNNANSGCDATLPVPDVESSTGVLSYSDSLASNILGTMGPAILQSYSNNLAKDIMSKMGSDIRSTTFLSICKEKSTDKEENEEPVVNGVTSYSSSDLSTSSDNSSLVVVDDNDVVDGKLDCSTIPEIVETNSSDESHLNGHINHQDTNGNCDHEEESTITNESASLPDTQYAGVTSIVMPLVDKAILHAKTIVRRRSSTNFLTIDGDTTNDEEDTEPSDETPNGCTETIPKGNASYNRKTLIELIDQAVENVVPTVNGCRDKLLNSSLQNVYDIDVPPHQNNTNGTDLPHENVNFILDEELLSEPCAGNDLQNKENSITPNKKRKSKKKKKKKKGGAGGAEGGTNRNPESIDRPAVASSNTNGHVPIKTTDLDNSFDSDYVLSSSHNNTANEICTGELPGDMEADKFSLALDMSFNEMEASRGSTPDTLDGFQ